MSTKRTVTSRMTLDVVMPDIQKTVTVTQGDINRRFEITLVDNGKPFQLGVKWTVALAGVKPSGAQIYNSCTVSQGKIIYDFAGGPEIATEAGAFDVQFDIYDEVGDVLASPKIWISVLPNKNREMQSEDQFTATQDILRRINETEEEKLALVQAAVDDAKTVENDIKTAEDKRKETVNKMLSEVDEQKETVNTMLSEVDEQKEAINKMLSEADEQIRKAIKEQVADSLDIANDLETDDAAKALSAAQGVVLKEMINASAGSARIATGSYEGTGTNYYSLYLPFIPSVIFIVGNYSYYVDELENSDVEHKSFEIRRLVLPAQSYVQDITEYNYEYNDGSSENWVDIYGAIDIDVFTIGAGSGFEVCLTAQKFETHCNMEGVEYRYFAIGKASSMV